MGAETGSSRNGMTAADDGCALSETAGREMGGTIMTAQAKKREMVEGIAEKFLLLPESVKSFIAGYLTGKEEERARWQQEQERKRAAVATV